jgi:hypothetical protein
MGRAFSISLLCVVFSAQSILASLVDLTSANRRDPIPGLPDWSQAGYEKGQKPLPDDSLVSKTITSDQLASQYGVIANDGKDDTDGLQQAIFGEYGICVACFPQLIQL